MTFDSIVELRPLQSNYVAACHKDATGYKIRSTRKWFGAS